MVVICLLPLLAACSPKVPDTANDSVSSEEPSATPVVPPHNYLSEEGGAYTYTMALTDDQKKSGQAAENVLLLKYKGLIGGEYTFTDENGAEGFYCEDPCEVVKQTYYGNVVGRMTFNPQSVAGAAIEDAMNGYLVASPPPSSPVANAAPVTAQASAVSLLQGPSQPEESIQVLLSQEAQANEVCRGGNHTPDDDVCKLRDSLDQELNARGWCYGQGAASDADSVWAPCRS